MYTPVQIPTYLHDTFPEYFRYVEKELPTLDLWAICMWHFHQIKPILPSHTVENIIVADACIDCIIDQKNQTIFLSGLSTIHRDVISDSHGDGYGIRMRPGAAHALFGIHASEAMDRRYDVTECLVDALFWSLDYEEQVIRLITRLEYLGSQVTSRRALDWFELVFENHYLNSVDTIATYFGYSTKQLNRLFMEYYGMNVKAILMVIRMQKALDYLIHNPDESLTSLAVDMGYYDQSHFINDLKIHLGMTPYAVLKRIEHVSFFQ